MAAMVATVMQDIDPDALASLERIARALLRGFGEPELVSPTESDLLALGARLNEEVITVSTADPDQYALALAFEELRPRRQTSLKTISTAVNRIISQDADRSTRRIAYLAAQAALAESDLRASIRREGRPEEARSRAEACLAVFGWSFAQIAELTDPGHGERVSRRVRRYLVRCGSPKAIVLEAEVQGTKLG